MSWLLCNNFPSLAMAPAVMPDHWGACSASSYCASFLLHLICHLVASEVGNSLLNMTFRHAASASCSTCLKLAIEEASWSAAHCNAPLAQLQTSPLMAHPKSHLSSAPASSCSSLHPQRPPQEISNTLGFSYGCSLFVCHIQSLPGTQPPVAALLALLSHHLNQTSGGEEVVYFTFKHSVMADTCHKISRLIKIQVFQEKFKPERFKVVFPFPSYQLLTGAREDFIVQLKS